MVQFKDYLIKAKKYQGGKARCGNRHDIIKLSSNENQFGSSPMALDAIAKALSGLSEYPDNDDSRLRNALAAYYDDRMQENQFICAPGASEIIDLLCRAFLEPGSEVMVSSPTFIPFTVYSEKMGAQVIDVPLKGRTFDFPVDSILEKINKKTRLIFLASPNNPIGNYISKNKLAYLLSNVPEHVVVVFDEVYFHFAKAADYCTAIDFVQRDKNIFASNSFSKVYGLAGLRLGYGYGPPRLVDYVRYLSKPFLNSRLALEAGVAALQDTIFVGKTVLNNHEQKKYLYHEFDRLQLKYWPSETNFILVQPSISDAMFTRNLLERNIMVRPVGLAGAPGCIRISIGTSDQNRQLIKALDAIRN